MGASGRSTNGGASGVFGGDGSQYVIKLPVDIGSAVSVARVIGAGGASSALKGATNHGTPTSFGAFLTAASIAALLEDPHQLALLVGAAITLRL